MDAPFDTLVAMGFKAGRVRAALKATSGDTDSALEMLLGEHAEPSSTTGTTNQGARPEPGAKERSTESLIHASISQYSVENGRSACTCIALTAASLFLEEPTIPPPKLAPILQLAILEGVKTYQRMNAASNVEHMSAEEVLKQRSHPFQLKMKGSIQQGILSNSSDNPLGFAPLLSSMQEENYWVTVLITKTPESVVVCLPPKSMGGLYILLDSHPRPQVHIPAAYASVQQSLEDLAQTLMEVFPATNLGNDVSETMAMMYNSFDLYPLVRLA